MRHWDGCLLASLPIHFCIPYKNNNLFREHLLYARHGSECFTYNNKENNDNHTEQPGDFIKISSCLCGFKSHQWLPGCPSHRLTHFHLRAHPRVSLAETTRLRVWWVAVSKGDSGEGVDGRKEQGETCRGKWLPGNNIRACQAAKGNTH